MTNSTQNDREPGVSCSKKPKLPNLFWRILGVFSIRDLFAPPLKPIPIKAIRPHTRKNQRGNVFAMLFAAVALTGVLAAVGMQTLTGPVTTITRVTQKNIAETNLLMNAKIIANAVPLGPNAGDYDSDSTKEPAPFVPAGGGETAPSNGGFLPTTLGLALTDPWGSKYGYCVWDHGSTTNGANYIDGDNTTVEQISIQPLLAVISAGPDKVFQTGCPTFSSGVMSTTKASGSDDLVQEFTYEGASAAANGLWTLDSPGGAVAQLKAADNSIKASIDRSSGVANFLGITTDTLSAITDVVAMDGGLKLDAAFNTCGATEDGTIKYNSTTKRVELCNGTAWVALGGDLWQTDETHIWRATGNVGIGDNTPTSLLDVAGTFNATGAATLGSTLGVTGNTTLGGTLGVTGNSTLSGTLGVTGATTLSSTLDVTGNTDIGGTLNADGATTLGSTLDVTGNTGLDGSLDVTGATTLDSTLNVAGATILSDTLDVTEEAIFADTMEVAGAVNFLTTLNVTGNTVIDTSTLFVDAADDEVGIGTATPAAKLDVAGGIKISTHATCAAGGANNGTIQYDNSIKKMQVCVDGTWSNVSSIDKLDDIGDVYVEEAGTPNNNDILTWDSGNARWVAKNINSVGPAAVSPAGSNGSIQFKDGSDLGADAATLHWDKTNDRLGVGTNSPADTLSVTGTVGVTGNSSLTGTLSVSGDATFDTNTLFVDALNNGVGIGTTTPFAKLDVNGGIKLGNASTCAAGGANNGTMRFNTNQLQICVSGTWSAVSTSSGGGMAGSAPDAIDCGVSGVKRVLYLQTTTATEYRYGFIAGDTGVGMLVSYAVADGSHVATSNTAGWSNATGCDGKDFAALTSENRSFYLIGGAGLSGLVTGAAGSNNEVQFRNSGNGAFDSQSTFVYDKAQGRLGIGKASPDRPLHVAAASTATIIIENTSAAVDQKKRFIAALPTSLNFGVFTDDMSGTTTGLSIFGNGVAVNAGSMHASAVFQADATTRGFLPPRMSDPSAAIASPAAGLIAYNTTTNKLMVYNNSTWIALGSVDDGDKGDITVSSNGATWTIDANAVTTTKINDGAVTSAKIGDAQVTSVKINDGAVTTAKIGDAQVTSVKINDGAVTAAKLDTGAVTTTKVGDDQITFAKTQNIATNKLLGRATAGSGDIEEITLGSGLSFTGTTLNVATGSGVGDVVGPASSTDNAIARFDGTTGKIIQDSAVTIGDAGQTTITSADANALVVGPNGATNPVLKINGSGTPATGVEVTGAAAGSGVTISAISSAANENLAFSSKAGGDILFKTSTTNRLRIADSTVTFTPTTGTTSGARFSFTGAADTTLAADTETPSVYFNMGQTRTHTAGAGTYSAQRDFRITPSTHAFDAADSINMASTLGIDGAPKGGTNATIYNSVGLYIGTSTLTNVSNGTGLVAYAPSGAANNAAAQFIGDVSVLKYGTATGLMFNRANGTESARTAILNNDVLGNITWTGQGATTGYAGSAAKIDVIAAENWTDSTGAASLAFSTRDSNVTGPSAERMRIDKNGNVGIGTTSPNSGAILDLTSTSKGLLIPRQADPTTAITSPANGLIAYDSTNHVIKLRANGAWVTLAASGGSGVGDVVGPASSTDNAIARYDGTTGKLIQNSAVTIGDAGATTITSADANALIVGPNGATNPVLQVDTSQASQVSGIKVTGWATGAGPVISAISPDTNSAVVISGKGGAGVRLQANGTTRMAVDNTGTSISTGPWSTAATPRFLFTSAADTTLDASTEAPNIYFNMGNTRQHATGAITLQRDFRITPSTHSFVGASAITTAAALSVDGPPSAGTNATITTAAAIHVPTKALSGGTVTNAYGMVVEAPSGATGVNYAADFVGKVTANSMIMKVVTGANAPSNGAGGLWSTSGSDLYRASGNVAIGTNSPWNVAGYSGLTLGHATNGGMLTFKQGGTARGYIYNSAGANQLNIEGSAAVNITDGTNSRLFVNTATGNVGIGTGSPSYKLDVTGNTRVKDVQADMWLEANGYAAWRLTNYQDAIYFWRTGSGDRFILNANGDMTITGAAAKPGGGSWTASSDARLKDIDGDYNQGLDSIVKLKPTMFHYKKGNARNEPSDKQFYGLIAQDVQKVFPEAVEEKKDGFLSLDTTPITFAVINAIKEIKSLIDDLVGKVAELFDVVGKLKLEVADLKAENATLKSQNADILKRLDALEAEK